MASLQLGSTPEGPLTLESSDLTTHGVIVGMTGSGKTGLAIVLLEEALAAGIPALILDPKGDMGNLEAGDVTIYTPGSEAGVPLNLVGSLQPPPLSWDTESEALRDEIESTVTSLLGLVGIAADPLAGREFVLLANLIENAWRAGRDLDLATLIGEVQAPPLRKLGVFDVDTFFPPRDRTALAMRLNGLVASPAFAAWGAGAPLDVGALLGRRAARVDRLPGAPLRAGAPVRGHPGADQARHLDARPARHDRPARTRLHGRGLGFAPPTATPPAKKPILTILKQARAYGVGMVLATQNPVDLDYKAMANAGTWLVGRLQTENDKARVLEGLRSAAGGADVAALDAALGGLAKRRFMLVGARSNRPVVFATRDAHSHLSGPLTRDQVAERRRAGAPPLSRPAPPAPAAPDVTPVAPPVAAGVPLGYLDLAAPWAARLGAAGGGPLRAYLAARVSVRFDDAKAAVDALSEFEALYGPLDAGLDLERETVVDFDDRDFAAPPPAAAVYVLPAARIGDGAFFRKAERDIRRRVIQRQALELRRNAKLKLISRPGESPEAFAQRADEAAQAAADAEAAKLRDRLAARQDRLEAALAQAQRRVEELTLDERSREANELAAGAGAVLGALFGGRRRTRSIAGALGGAASRRGAAARAEARRRSAEAKAADVSDDLLEIEQEILDEVAAIDAKWRAIAAAVDTVAIRPEAADVTVERLMLVWVPRSDAQPASAAVT